MSKNLFETLNEQFQSGEGFVVAKFEVVGQNENNLELLLNGTRYSCSGDTIVTIDAPAALTGIPDADIAVSDQAGAPSVPTAVAATDGEIVTEAPGAIHGDVETFREADAAGSATVAENAPVDAIGSEGAGEANGTALSEIVENANVADSNEAPAAVDADKALIDGMVDEVRRYYCAHDFDTYDLENGETGFILKNAEGEEIIRGSLSSLHEQVKRSAE